MCEDNDFQDRLTEFPDLTAELVKRHFVFPFWVHKFVLYGKTTFYVFHSPMLPYFPFPYVTFPNDTVGTTIENIELALPALGAADDGNWIIERINRTNADRYYKIHHNSGISDKCPRSGFYAKLQDIADNRRLSGFHNSLTCT